MANDIIDINVYETVETVAITVNPNLTTVNINKVTSSSGAGITNLSTTQTATNFTINSDTGTDASVPLGNGTLAGATLNDYTTDEKTKLSGIETGAEVNVNADWNATSGDAQILNKPTIPSISGLATVTDVDTQDALKQNNITLTTTGTSGASTLVGATLNIPQYNGATNLTTSQTSTNFTINSSTGDDAVVPLGNGSNAGATLNDYTTVEKNKLAGIAVGAEVNVNADWNAVSGDAQILNKPTISGTNTGDQNLQQVTDLGASTTTPITANSFVKSGGTSSQILAADGSVITAGTNITITGGQISSVGGTGGGGSSVNYYLNGGTSQGTFGGTTYYEFSKTAVIGTGADFSRSTNGYIASFITDVADPSLLLIPAGNWNLEFFFNASSNGGSPSFYVELYKYDGTTFTLIASNSTNPEGITGGTAIDAYFTPLAVPETVLTVNDRLAIRVFVNASSKTITLHTQNGHLCEVITTFTAGLTALNGLQAQVQNFATGTTGTDFAINSSGSTHTFNLPSASATARGVVTTASQTFAGDKTFTGAISASNLSGTNTGDQDLSSYAPIASPTFTGTVVLPSTTSIGTVSSTEIGYLDNVTSSIQTQLDNKIAKNIAATYTTNTITTVTAAEYAAIGTKDANTLYFIV